MDVGHQSSIHRIDMLVSLVADGRRAPTRGAGGAAAPPLFEKGVRRTPTFDGSESKTSRRKFQSS